MVRQKAARLISGGLFYVASIIRNEASLELATRLSSSTQPGYNSVRSNFDRPQISLQWIGQITLLL